VWLFVNYKLLNDLGPEMIVRKPLLITNLGLFIIKSFFGIEFINRTNVVSNFTLLLKVCKEVRCRFLIYHFCKLVDFYHGLRRPVVELPIDVRNLRISD
jgi:hypothetical protein